MSAFNTLKASVTCPGCSRVGLFEVQLKFGDTWQHEYTIGDSIRWGGNDYGSMNEGLVRIDGIGGPCRNCAADDLPFIIAVLNDRIEAVMPQFRREDSKKFKLE